MATIIETPDRQPEETSLYKLSELKDFEISPNNPDVRGWTLIALDGERIGKVKELIVDTKARKVRYLDVEVDKDIARGKDHHILIPIGTARLHKNDNNVLVESVDRYHIGKYPMFDGVTITPEYERALRRAMNSSTAQISPSDTALQPTETSFPPDRSVSQARLDEMQAELEARRNSQYRARQDQSTNRSALQNSEYKPTTPDENRSRQTLEDALRVAMAERDVALKERDIARAERDIMRMERDQALSDQKESFYNSEHFNEDKFYENRRKSAQ
jgi:sporulation protein YlmC with PRC-barrel domain